ncbi:OmpA family protein [Vibrio fluvialis]|nr:OmpA family protein [Vibrio fluvialis]
MLIFLLQALPLFILIGIFANPVFAVDQFSPFFVEVKGGRQWALDNSYTQKIPSDSIWGVYSGLHFSPSLRWDVGYQYHEDLKADSSSIVVRTRLIESAFRYDWYLQDNLSLYGRIGVAYWDMRKSHVSSNKFLATGFSPTGEMGINYRLTSSLQLSAGYQYVDSIGDSKTGKYDSHGLLLGFNYSFGREAKPRFERASVPSIGNVSDPIEKVSKVKKLSKIQFFPSRSVNGLFRFDSVEISYDFFEQLSELALVLNSYPQSRAIIVGHTDSTGTMFYNRTLSEKRAQTVVNQLIELGVSPSQLDWIGEGESRPIFNNTTTEGRSQNRRVEVKIPSFQF